MRDLDDLLRQHDGVVDTSSALLCMTLDELKWRIRSGRWQKPVRGVVVAHSGPLTDGQTLRVALAWAGPRAAIGGLTAAILDGLKGYGDREPFPERPIHLVLPPGRNIRPPLPGVTLIRHYSRLLGPEDVHPVKVPRRTRIARSLVDAAAWMPTERGAVGVIAAGVQQRLVRVIDLEKAVARNPRHRRRKLIKGTLGDIAGGVQALSELDFDRQVIRRYKLPEPTRQVTRRDRNGRRRYIDVAWDEWKLAVEIDGAQHMDPLHQWDDMDKSNELEIDGYRVLRFPSWVIRRHPDQVASQIQAALRRRPQSFDFCA